MRSTTQYAFSRVPQANIQRSVFNRTHGHKTTFDAGKLIPFFIDEVLPGDSFNVNATIFARLATPFVPVMDNLFADIHFFFVPNRLVWDHWQNHMGEQENPDDDPQPDYQTPIITAPAGGFLTGSLADYFGIPVGIAGLQVSALPFRAYNLIFNEWYRHQDLQPKVYQVKNDGPDNPGNFFVWNRNKRHDYFTSCLPWPQKGPGVELPLGTTAPVITTPGYTASPYFRLPGDSPDGQPLSVAAGAGTHNTTLTGSALNTGGPLVLASGQYGSGMVADLSQAASATINSLREAFQLQRLYERDARSGTRYTEILRSHFGVTSPDSRLQRPEFLGGSNANVHITPIAQTSATATEPTPQGNLAAMGTFTARAGFTKSFVEHGHIIGIINVRADLSYQQGLHRMWSRRTRFDYYWPVLSHLGEDAVLNKEIYAQGTSADDQAFGYQERWAEYRYAPSKITGKMRSTETGNTPLDVWHLGQNFATLPTLSPAFMEDQPPVKRISAVPTEPDFLMDSVISVRATRPMPTYSVPGMIDHF